MSVGSLDQVVRRADVLWRRSGPTILIRRPGEDQLAVLADTGLALWEAIVEPITVGDLCDHLSSSYGVDMQVVIDDVEVALMDLVDRGVVRRD